MKKYFVLSCLLIGVSSCSTLSKQAKEQLENKNYDEALILFDRLVQEKPNDGEALEGQRKSREGVVDKNLIRVRLARMGQNYQESLDLLRDVVLKEREWNLYPSGAVAFTQAEETNEAKKIINRELTSILKEKKPLKVLFWVERYKLMFDEKFQTYLTNFKKSAMQEGASQCGNWTKTTSAATPFWSQFVKRYCNVMQVQKNIPAFDKKLYAKVDLKLEQPTIPKPLENLLASEMNKAFLKTGWYDVDSKRNLGVVLNGTYSFADNRHMEQRTHSYEESIPYTAYVEKEKFDSTGKSYKVSEPTTRYRDEQRFHRYMGTSIYQKIQMQSNLRSDVNLIHALPFSFDKNVNEFTHNENMPSIHLSPQGPVESKPEGNWQTQIAGEYSAEFKKSLIADFKTAFCDPLSESMNPVMLSDQSLLCLRETIGSPYMIVERHFKNQFGLTVLETNSLVKLLD